MANKIKDSIVFKLAEEDLINLELDKDDDGYIIERNEERDFAYDATNQYKDIIKKSQDELVESIAQEYNQMEQDEKNTFAAKLQLEAIDKLLDAIKEGKKTTKEAWKNVLNRLNIVKDFEIIYEDEIKNVNLQSIIQKIIPLAGALAATFLALKESDKKESESAEPEENELLTEDLLKLENVNERNKEKSLIIQYCNENKNGFSLNGQQ